MAHEPTEEQDYDSYEGFLRAAIRAYWESGSASRVNFLALLLACRETWQVAWTRAATSPGRILTGAAGAAAIAVLLRTFLGGPIGILLGGASVASLVAVYVKNHERIWRQVARYRGLIEDYRGRFEQVRGDYIDEKVDRQQRDLMLDGLMSRFLSALDEEPPAEHEGEGEGKAEGDKGDSGDDESFSSYVKR